MPKRIGFLFDKLLDQGFIKEALFNAAAKKKKRKAVKRALAYPDETARRIVEIIRNGYQPSPPHRFHITETPSRKERDITSLPFFPDVIIQWAVSMAMLPILNRGMDPDCCGSVKGRGTSKAEAESIWFIANKRFKYYLKIDLHHFYQSIPKPLLMIKLRHIIKDERFLDLIQKCISFSDQGLCIGALTSQYLSNYFFQDLEHLISQKLKINHIRYVDDYVLFSNNKRDLYKAHKIINDFVFANRITMNKNWIITKTEIRPLDFVGRRYFRSGSREMRKRDWRSARRVMLKCIKHGYSLGRAKRFMAFYGMIKDCGSSKIFSKYCHHLGFSIDLCRKIISKEAKKEN